MKNLIRICLFTMLLFVTGDLAAQNIHLSTPRTSLVLSAPAGGELKYVYYGSNYHATWGLSGIWYELPG